MFSPTSPGAPGLALITIVCGWLFTALATLAIGLLLWYRRRRRLGKDDYTTLAAFIISVALVAQTTWAIVHEGLDRKEDEVSRPKRAAIIRALMVNETLWGLVNTLVRVTALMLIDRAFPNLRNLIRGLMVVSILYALATVLDIFLICRPVAAAWDVSVSGACGNQVASYVALEILGLVIDVIISIIPPISISKTSMRWQQKALLSCVFSVGILVLIVTALRIQALHLVNSPDFTYSEGYLGLLSIVGALLGIILCSAPNLAPILDRRRKKSLCGGTTIVDESTTGTVNAKTPERPLRRPEASTVISHVCSTGDLSDRVQLPIDKEADEITSDISLEDPVPLTEDSANQCPNGVIYSGAQICYEDGRTMALKHL